MVEKWLIVDPAEAGDDESLRFWSNSEGWGTIGQASRFTNEERWNSVSLPVGGAWVQEGRAHVLAAAPAMLEGLKRLANIASTAAEVLRGTDAAEAKLFKKDAELARQLIREAEGRRETCAVHGVLLESAKGGRYIWCPKGSSTGCAK